MKRTHNFSAWGVFLGVLLSMSVVLVGGAAFHYYQKAKIVEAHTTQSPPPESTKAKPIEEKPEKVGSFNILLLGTDERKNEASRSDTIIVAHFSQEDGKVKMVSIPRDSLVEIPGRGKDKINAAHAYGKEALIEETVENLLGIEIDYYAKVNFKGFTKLVEAIGGVSVNSKRAFYYEGHTFPVGKQHLDGKAALSYVRFRKNVDGDFGRIERQREVIENVIKKIIKEKDVFAIPDYVSIYNKYVDTNLEILPVVKSVFGMENLNSLAFEGITLKTTSSKVDGIWYEIIDEASLNEVITELGGTPPDIIEDGTEGTDALTDDTTSDEALEVDSTDEWVDESEDMAPQTSEDAYQEVAPEEVAPEPTTTNNFSTN